MRRIELSGNTALHGAIELAGGGKVAPERLLDDDARMFGQP